MTPDGPPPGDPTADGPTAEGTPAAEPEPASDAEPASSAEPAADAEPTGEPTATDPVTATDPAEQGELSARDVAVLALERRGWAGPGAKERAIRERLGMSPTRYYQVLNALLDDPRALRHDPVTVNRLRRLRAARRSRR
ncbi:DUF3263 domain-containing protein [Streptomyces buecherae]|uniref:DUF3263 domain-containing protein n=3 Tax=Streptomyces buecherae TaxID=2763006 RepID=UPI001C26FE2A|nr:DUF3263 domain-containing protein [Streptomyces buecherae]